MERKGLGRIKLLFINSQRKANNLRESQYAEIKISHSSTIISKSLRVSLVVSASASAVHIVHLIDEIRTLGTKFQSEDELLYTLNSVAQRGTIVGDLYIAACVLSALLFCIWTFRANRFVRYLGASNLRYSPLSSVGWFFIPLLSFWKPYQAMSDLSRASVSPSGWQSIKCDIKLAIWWSLLIAAIVFGAIINAAALGVNEYSEVAIQSLIVKMYVISDLLWVTTFLLGYVNISHISKAQTRALRRRTRKLDSIVKLEAGALNYPDFSSLNGSRRNMS